MPTELVPGIDMGGTFTKIGRVDREGSIHHEDKSSTRSYDTVETFIVAGFPG